VPFLEPDQDPAGFAGAVFCQEPSTTKTETEQPSMGGDVKTGIMGVKQGEGGSGGGCTLGGEATGLQRSTEKGKAV